MDIGNQLQYLRKHHNLSLRELSERSQGMSISYLSDIEHGRTIPTVYSLEKIANAFGMSLPVFLGGANLDLSSDEQELINAYRANDYVSIMRLLVTKNTATD